MDANGEISSTPSLTASSTVNKIIRLPDGKFLIGGQFTAVNGVTRNQVARLNADLTLDTTFDPGTTFPGFREVYALAIDRDGKYMVAINDNTFKYLVRLNPDGTRDTGFTSNASSIVYNVIPQNDGTYLLGGVFSNWDGTGSTTDSYVILVNSDGTLNSSIDYLQSGISTQFLFQRGDGSLVTGTNQTRLELLGADGIANTAFFQNLQPNIGISDFLEDASGDIYLGGAFSTVNGNATNRLLKLKPGSPAPSVESRFDIGSGFNGTVRTLTLAENGELWVGGDFTQFNGDSSVRIITRLRNESQPSGGASNFADFIAGFTLPQGQETFDADPDGDGFDNGIEFLLGGNPGVTEPSLIPPAAVRTGTAHRPCRSQWLSHHQRPHPRRTRFRPLVGSGDRRPDLPHRSECRPSWPANHCERLLHLHLPLPLASHRPARQRLPPFAPGSVSGR